MILSDYLLALEIPTAPAHTTLSQGLLSVHLPIEFGSLAIPLETRNGKKKSHFVNAFIWVN